MPTPPKWLVLARLEPSKLHGPPVPEDEPAVISLMESDCFFFVLMNLFFRLAVEAALFEVSGFGKICYLVPFFFFTILRKDGWSVASTYDSINCSLCWRAIGVVGAPELMMTGPESCRLRVSFSFSALVKLGLPKVSTSLDAAKEWLPGLFSFCDELFWVRLFRRCMITWLS